MALIIPYIDYKAKRDAILSLLRANTTTLNQGLTNGTFDNPTIQIIAGDIAITPVYDVVYPVIMVKLINKTEDFRNIGSAGRKIPVLTFRIYGITQKIESDIDAEIMLLTKNLESVFRDNISVNDNFLWVNPSFADFGAAEMQSGVWTSVVAINLDCNLEVK